MKTRYKRLVTSVCALFVAIIALASGPAGATGTPSASYCNFMYYCSSTCDGSGCVDMECGADCGYEECAGGSHLVVCQGGGAPPPGN